MTFPAYTVLHKCLTSSLQLDWASIRNEHLNVFAQWFYIFSKSSILSSANALSSLICIGSYPKHSEASLILPNLVPSMACHYAQKCKCASHNESKLAKERELENINHLGFALDLRSSANLSLSVAKTAF
mmetsp:Transcript_14307/g.20310  ORF Transcript_14307/g.20310 Transcript_14307/m.20310 type:complete len:129 (+) Transcript_14307:152-538(+)